MNEEELAQAVGKGMFEGDLASQLMGMELLQIGPGHARMRMTVRADMLNGHKTCHGGFMFTLADLAFAFACNARNDVTVAMACHITFIAPALLNDVLVAEALERSRSGRTGVYDVEVRKADGSLIALFRGNSYRTGGAVVDMPATATLPGL